MSNINSVIELLLFLDGGCLIFANHLARLAVLVVGSGLFLVFHSPILEPNLDLPLSKGQVVRYFNTSSARQVSIVVKFLLQF